MVSPLMNPFALLAFGAMAAFSLILLFVSIDDALNGDRGRG